MDLHRLTGFNGAQTPEKIEREHHLPSYPGLISSVIP
jgi:hypothetical protein